MKIPMGTRSLLYGAHCWFIHPWFVFAAWWKLFGFPLDPRLWLLFLIHDWGYWGLPRMDDAQGELHPTWAADVMWRWFGPQWHDLALYHSRFLAKRDHRPFSKLCVADKLAVAMEPWWLYLPRVIASGEIREYMALADQGKYDTMNVSTVSRREWFATMTDYLRRWAAEHRDMKADRWTPESVPGRDS